MIDRRTYFWSNKNMSDGHDKVMINRIKDDLEDWLTTHGEITMGSEMVKDVHKIVEESIERTKRIREDWMLPDRC